MKKAKLLASLKHSFRESVAGSNVSTSKVVLAFVFYGIGLQWYESELSGFQIASIKKDHKELQAKISQSCIYSGILGFLRIGSPKNENTHYFLTLMSFQTSLNFLSSLEHKRGRFWRMAKALLSILQKNSMPKGYKVA